MNYARRQQYRRLARAAAASVASAAAALLGLAVGSIGVVSLASVLDVVALVFALYGRHSFVLAGRSRVGASSEDDVRHALATLRSTRGEGRGRRGQHYRHGALRVRRDARLRRVGV